MLLYPLLGELGLCLCCSSVDVGEGSPGDGVAVTLLTLGAVIAMMGHRALHGGICHLVARNADVALELSVFDRDLSVPELLCLPRDPPTDTLARAFIVSLPVQ